MTFISFMNYRIVGKILIDTVDQSENATLPSSTPPDLAINN